MAQIQLPKNIVKMFNNIQINGIDYKTEETTVSPSAQQILAENRESAQNILQSSIEQEIGQEVKAVELNETLHNVKDESARNNILKEVSTRAREITRVEGLIESEVSTRASEITRVEGLIESEASTRASTDATLNNNINTINSKIPSQASKTNQLADKDFVNSSIATNTANFIGTFTDIEELKRQPATNNDYAFWLTTDSAGNILFKRYKYIASTSSWVFEYDLNNSSFTSEQWLAIQSGITAVLVAKLKGIEEGAQVNTITGVKGGNESSYRTGNVNITKDNVGLGNVVNTGDSAIPTSGGTTKFTTGGAYTELAKKNDKITITDDSSTALTDADTFSTTDNTGTNPTNLTKRPLSLLWTYIKGKLSSVFGLTETNYNGKAATSGVADSATKATQDSNGNNIVNTYATKSELTNSTFKVITISKASSGATTIDFNTFTDNALYRPDSDMNHWGTVNWLNAPTPNRPEGGFALLNLKEGSYTRQILSLYTYYNLYIRYSYWHNGITLWNDWQEMANISNISKANSLALPAIIDLNVTVNSSDVGRLYTHSFASTATNAPVATAGFVMTHCMSTTSTMQTAYCGKQIFTRTLSGTTWSAWSAMWNTEES